MSKTLRVNHQIRVREVRVIDEDGGQLGILPIAEALAAAEERELDLVEVAPTTDPPVCKIMDFGKYKYVQSKRSQEARKKQRHIQVKEVKMRVKIETHDYQFKARNAERFLREGHKVKVTIMFRGREVTRPELGTKLLDRLTQDMAELAQREQQPSMEGRNMTMLLSPRPRVRAAARAEAAAASQAAPAPSGGGEDAQAQDQ
ncbi:MAG: translation initiation factor IF-3 [Nitrospinota bacterium]